MGARLARCRTRRALDILVQLLLGYGHSSANVAREAGEGPSDTMTPVALSTATTISFCPYAGNRARSQSVIAANAAGAPLRSWVPTAKP